MMHIDLLRIGWGLDGVKAIDVGAVDEHTIDAKPVGLMAGDLVRDFVGRITVCYVNALLASYIQINRLLKFCYREAARLF